MPQIEGMHEADITIHGTTLTFAQSMTVRVAVSTFLMTVCLPEYAEALGPIAAGYRERLREVERLIIEPLLRRQNHKGPGDHGE